jgi:hypothetical protein
MRHRNVKRQTRVCLWLSRSFSRSSASLPPVLQSRTGCLIYGTSLTLCNRGYWDLRVSSPGTWKHLRQKAARCRIFKHAFYTNDQMLTCYVAVSRKCWLCRRSMRKSCQSRCRRRRFLAHKKLAAGIDRRDKPLKKVDLLHQFARLSQHPLLLDASGDTFSVDELKCSSSKLRAVLKVLHEIRARGEKVLVFARHRDVQRMFARVFSDEFGMPVRVVNGETPRGANLRGTAIRSRKQIIEHFGASPGFQILILSPFVAGVGLTITEANHVVHYGRWWNPAVESQATDRVYRIGQKRTVHVHLPILCDPSGEAGTTFDELLNRLLQGKKSLSERMLDKADFLRPPDSEGSSAVALFDELATNSKSAQP